RAFGTSRDPPDFIRTSCHLQCPLWPTSQLLAGSRRMSGRFVFRSEWRLPAPPDQVYAVLADVAAYPAWWPQIRGARRFDATSGELTCRSLLPYDLVFR